MTTQAESFFFVHSGFDCMVAPSRDANKSVKQPSRGAMPGEGGEPESGGNGNQGSEREHMRSSAYYSCTDGAADEMGGIDG